MYFYYLPKLFWTFLLTSGVPNLAFKFQILPPTHTSQMGLSALEMNTQAWVSPLLFLLSDMSNPFLILFYSDNKNL